MGRTIPILAMTANAFSEDVKDCLDAGMDALAAKPLDTAVLERTSEACRHGTSAPRNHIRKYRSPPCGKGRMGAVLRQTVVGEAGQWMGRGQGHSSKVSG